jgi:hypothetical protein
MPEITLAGPRRGLKDYVDGTPGFYVVNPNTNISNHPRFRSRLKAKEYLGNLNAKYGSDPNVQIVIEIGTAVDA